MSTRSRSGVGDESSILLGAQCTEHTQICTGASPRPNLRLTIAQSPIVPPTDLDDNVSIVKAHRLPLSWYIERLRRQRRRARLGQLTFHSKSDRIATRIRVEIEARSRNECKAYQPTSKGLQRHSRTSTSCHITCRLRSKITRSEAGPGECRLPHSTKSFNFKSDEGEKKY